MFYALGDLHLGSQVNKPMDVFGDNWADHARQIEAKWTSVINADDVVLIPGDISWAMTLNEAEPDLQWIANLPGSKVMIRGNHDYWWSGIGKVRSLLTSDFYALQNDAMLLQNRVICGTRGWLLPSHPKFSEEDSHIFRREVERLRLSLTSARNYNPQGNLIAMLHYPPCSHFGEDTPFTELLEAYEVTLCVYGHLHGGAHRYGFNGTKNGTVYQLVSADYVDFCPMLLQI